MVLGILKRPHLPETENYSPQNDASATMLPAGGRQNVHKKSIRDKVQGPRRNSFKRERLGLPAPQTEAEPLCFRTLVHSSELLHQVWYWTTAPYTVVTEMYYLNIVNYDKIWAHICAQSWIPVKTNILMTLRSKISYSVPKMTTHL